YAADCRAGGLKVLKPDFRRPTRSRTSSRWPSPADAALMSEKTYDSIVAGLGAHGSAAAYHLAKRGQTVLGFDRFARGHTLASFGGLSRIIRLSYYEHPSYVPLLKRAWELWRQLERDSGDTLLTQTGGLAMGPPDGELVAGPLANARTHGLGHERIAHAEHRPPYPVLHI